MSRHIDVKHQGSDKVEVHKIGKSSTVKVKGASSVKVFAERDDIKTMEQKGNDLIVHFSDGSQARLEGYFLCDASERPVLSVVDTVARQVMDVSFENGVCDAAVGTAHPLAYSFQPSTGDSYANAFLPVAVGGGIGVGPLLGLGAAVVGGGVVAGGGGGGGTGGGNGNGGGSAPAADTTAPAAPVVAPSNGTTLTGTAEPGSKVGLDIDGNGTTDATVTVDGSGNWSYTPPTPIANGTTVTAKATDTAGNTSAPGTTVVDAATTTPTITSVVDDFGPATGVVAKGGATDDKQPEIKGSGAEANATVSVYDGNSLIGTTKADAAGNWSLTPTTALGDGAHSFTAKATDALGNASGSSAAYAVTIAADNAGQGPAITAVTDDVGSLTGIVARGGSTDDQRPELEGTGAGAGGTVSLFDGATLLGTTTADGQGNWDFTPGTALAEGAHSFTAKLGNGQTSASYTLSVDTTAPAAPVLDPTDGKSVGGTAEPGSTVGLDTNGDGTPDVTVPVDGNGTWTYTPPTPIPDGTTVTGTATDPAGNTSGPGSTVVDSDDTVPPPAPTITSVSDDVGTVAGAVANGGATDDRQPAVFGLGAGANATVSVFDGATLLGTTKADGTGAWSFTPSTPLAEGPHSLTVKTTDGSGDSSAASAAYAIVVDTTAPAAPVLNPTDGSAVTGTAEAGSTVTLDIDGNGTTDATVPVDGSGNWSYTPATPIPDGTTITGRATDPVGNTSGPGSTVVDRDAPPPAPVITALEDDVGSVTGVVANGGVTDDRRPAIDGAGAQANATISVYDGTTLLGTTTSNASGNWSFTPSSALGEGAHSFTAKVTDSGGDTGAASTAYTVTVDTTPPPPPVINPTNGAAVTGTAEAGSRVGLDLDGNGTTDATVPVNASGNWSYTPPSPIADGTTIAARATDPAGNTSAPASAVVDSDIAPPAPVINVLTDDVGSIVGPVASGGVTDDRQPAIGGSGAQANATVSVYDGANLLGTTKSDGSGNWSFTPPALVDGAHAFMAKVTDSQGDTSTASPVYTVTVDTTPPPTPVINPTDGSAVTGTAEPGSKVSLDIDGNGTTDVTVTTNGAGGWTFTPTSPIAEGTTITAKASDAAGNTSGPASTVVDSDAPPPAPVILSLDDNVGTVVGTVLNGGATDDKQPEVSGSGAQANTTVSVYDGGNLLGTTKADGSGNWRFTPSSPLGEGAHSFTAKVTDSGGDTSAASPAYTVTVDTTAPAAPAINPTDGTALTGTAEPGSKVGLDIDGNGTIDATVPVNGSGNWSYTPQTTIPDGTTVTARATDAAGNTSGPGTTIVDSDVLPPSPVITEVDDDVGTVMGVVLSGGVTDDKQPDIKGSGAQANATVSVYDGANLIGTTKSNASGDWSLTPSSLLGEGKHDLTAKVTDGQGDTSPASPVYTVTIDTTAPAIPAINPTDGTVLTGTAEPGSKVGLDVDGNGTIDTTVPVDGSGNWTYTPTNPIPDGTTVTAQATDPAGNTSGPATTVVDSATPPAPGAPAITEVDDDIGTVMGVVLSGGVTDDKQPDIKGSGAEANATVSVYDGGNLLGTTKADSLGGWTYAVSSTLGEGLHGFTAKVTGSGGTTSVASAVYTVTVDTTPPAAPTIDPSDGTVLTGTAEAGGKVGLDIDGNGTTDTTVSVDGTGHWTYTPMTTIPDGTTVTAKATDPAGNTSGPATTVVDDGTLPLPDAPAITKVDDDVGPVKGTVLDGGVTDDKQPEIIGSGAQANAKVSVYDGGNLIGTTTADAVGGWSFTPTLALGEGSHSLTAKVTDGQGGTGAASAAYVIAIDTIAAAPTITSVSDDVGTIQTPVADGGVTDDKQPTVVGAGAEANATISVYDGGNLLGTTKADVGGAWLFTPGTTLGEGPHSFTAKETDSAGNISAASTAYALTIDTTAPAIPVIAASDGSKVSGTAEPNASVGLDIDGNGIIDTTVPVDGSGNWTYTPVTAIPDGTKVSATAVDAAGNSSGPATTVVETNTPPTATVDITTITDDTGVIGDWKTDDRSPVVSGTVSQALAADERVEVRLDNGAWTTATTSGTSWFYGYGTLTTGAHTVDARVIDSGSAVGGTDSQGITITDVKDAPIVLARDNDLLGLVSAEALGLIDLDQQSLTAYDPDNNITSVQVSYAPLLSLNVKAYTLTGSTQLASELGLTVNVANDPGLLNLLAPSSVMTITAGGAPIDNLALNEFLSTVHFQQDLTILGLQLLSAISIKATDSDNLSASANTGSLVDLSLLNVNGNDRVIEGTSAGETLTGTGLSERLYGYGGTDILIGGGGNDLLRGGAGSDSLDGGSGNDLLFYDAADSKIDGGIGFDVLRVTSAMTLDATTKVANIERIDLGVGDGGHSVVLTEGGVMLATGTGQLYVTGDGSDSVTMAGAVFQGQVLVSGHAYNGYALGAATVFAEASLNVIG